MEFCRGLVVRARAGRDKGAFFTVFSTENGNAFICNGKSRKLEKPKRKNQKHLCTTGTVLQENELKTNREIRRALAPFTGAGCLPTEEAELNVETGRN